MPVPANPSLPEFYLYRFEFGGYPFYVGIGRSKRADYRQQYVRNLMRPEKAAILARKSLSVRVMAALCGGGHNIELNRIQTGLTREKALIAEREEIERLLESGIVLANRQHNRFGSRDVEYLVEAILSGSNRQGAKL